LVVAILGAAIAAGGNAVVSLINGMQQHSIENQKSEQARILEMIRTGDTEKAATNLQFLLDSGLMQGSDTAQRLKVFLANRKPGTGPSLPEARGILWWRTNPRDGGANAVVGDNPSGGSTTAERRGILSTSGGPVVTGGDSK
jgi:hypothetical protein